MRRLHNRIEETFGDIKPVDEADPFFQIGGHERQVSLRFRITFPRRTDRVLEEFLRGLVVVTDEVHGPAG